MKSAFQKRTWPFAKLFVVAFLLTLAQSELSIANAHSGSSVIPDESVSLAEPTLGLPIKLPIKKSTKQKTTHLATQLPAYKGKKRVTLSYDRPTDTQVVIVSDGSEGEQALPPPQIIVVKPTPAPTPISTPAPLQVALATATPVPVPTPIAMATPSAQETHMAEVSQAKPSTAASTATSTAAPIATATPVTQGAHAVVEKPAQTPLAVPTPETIATETIATETIATEAIAPEAVSPRSNQVTDSRYRAWETPSSTPNLSTNLSTNVATTYGRDRVLVLESGYLDARYDRLESDLKNGASTMSAIVIYNKQNYDWYLAIDAAHGMDQSVSPQTTRMLALRIGADAEMRLAPAAVPSLTGFAGASLGSASFDVRSYRAAIGTDITEREHAKGTAFAFIPEAGARVGLCDEVSLQIVIRDWILTGSEPLAKLGGASLSAGLGLSF